MQTLLKQDVLQDIGYISYLFYCLTQQPQISDKQVYFDKTLSQFPLYWTWILINFQKYRNDWNPLLFDWGYRSSFSPPRSDRWIPGTPLRTFSGRMLWYCRSWRCYGYEPDLNRCLLRRYPSPECQCEIWVKEPIKPLPSKCSDETQAQNLIYVIWYKQKLQNSFSFESFLQLF